MRPVTRPTIRKLYYNVKDYGVSGDGTTDDTAAIHALRTSAGAGSILFFPAGTYLVTTLTINVAQTWMLHRNATIKLKDATNASVIIVTVANVTIEGGCIDGNRANQSSGSDVYGVWAQTAANYLTLRNVEVKECRDHGVRLAQAHYGVVDGCHLHDNGTTANAAAGVLVLTSGGCRIVNNLCENMGTHGDAVTYDGDGIKVQDQSPTNGSVNVVANNICRHNARRGIKIQAAYCSVTGNVCEDNSSYGIGWTASGGLQASGTCTGNTCAENNGGIQIDNLSGLLVEGNYCRGNGAVDFYGILLGGAISHIIIKGNIVHEMGYNGIHLMGVQHGIVEGNLVFDIGRTVDGQGLQTGIYLTTDGTTNCTDVTVKGNKVYNTGAGTDTHTGIVVTANQTYIRVEDNDWRTDLGLTTAQSLSSSGTTGLHDSGNRIDANTPYFKLGDDAVYKLVSNTKTWDPADTADGDFDSTTITVTGAVVGNPVDVGFIVTSGGGGVPAGAILSGAVTAANTVTVTLFNKTGSNLNLGSGTLRASVWQYN